MKPPSQATLFPRERAVFTAHTWHLTPGTYFSSR